MEEYFDIEFNVEEINYTARVFPRYQELDAYFETRFHPADEKNKKRVFFIEMNNAGEWVEKIGMNDRIKVSATFISAVGRQIENNQI